MIVATSSENFQLLTLYLFIIAPVFSSLCDLVDTTSRNIVNSAGKIVSW